MSGRRAGNRISGPQSALTDFLASHNISAAQIRQDYEARRRRETQQDSNAATPATDEGLAADAAQQAADEGVEQEEAEAEEVEEDAVVSSGRKRKRSQVQVAESVKKAKKSKKEQSKKSKKKRNDSDSEDADEYLDSEDEDFVRDVYKKARPAPGQFAHCEQCDKRFTVTPYSKDGPDGGLLCTPCGKAMAKDLKAEKKASGKPVVRKRRKMESDKLDGLANRGAKSLQQLCTEKVVNNYKELDELGDMPQKLVDKISAIFCKRRVLKPNTLGLFLRADQPEITFHDAAYLDVDNYKEIFAVVPTIEKLVLGNACQFKDEVINYMTERCTNLKHFQVYAPNLVTNDGWYKMFQKLGAKLEIIKLKSLDAAFEDDNVNDMLHRCPKLRRLKLETCRRLTENTILAITGACALEHLSLQLSQPVQTPCLVDMITALGPNLQTLSLKKFQDADDSVLEAIHTHCTKLSKLTFNENDTATDAGFTLLFRGWRNTPLTSIDFNCTRDIDNNNPEGPELTIGLGSSGFKAMMAHSGPALKQLNVASCRHIELSAFLDVFNGEMQYPVLESINISFCNRVDTTVIAGIFKSCPALKKLVAFGCFDIGEVVVPRDIALIGIPKAQDAIEQFGTGLDVQEALGRMVEVSA